MPQRLAWARPAAAMVGLSVWLATAAAADEPPAVTNGPDAAIEISSSDAAWHRIGARHWARTRDPVARGVRVSVEVLVGADGVVLSARATDGPAIYHAAVESAALLDRYEPFTVNGIPVPVRFVARLPVLQEILPIVHVPFPEVTALSDVAMSMRVGACLGTCPSYEVSVTGDGRVTFTGGWFTAALGTYSYDADPEAAARLVEAFRAADFFSLSDEYVDGVTDGSRVHLAITVQGRTKTVLDDGGYGAGMPTAVRELEQAISDIAHTGEMIEGSAATVEMMKAQGFDFSSALGADALVQTADCCTDDYFEALLAAGVALSGRDHDGTPVSVTLLGRCCLMGRNQTLVLLDKGLAASRAIVEAAIARGSAEERTLALFGAVNLLDPDLARRLVTLPEDPAEIDAARGTDETPLLIWSACYDTTDRFDLMMSLGADVRVADDKERTLLHYACARPAWQKALDAGADLEARDLQGNTPLLTHAKSRDRALALLAAGADPDARGGGGSTPLMETDEPDVARALIAAGADLTLRNDRGATALAVAQATGRAEVVAALLAAGAE